MPDWKSHTYTLLHPFQVGERSYTAIVVKEPDIDAAEAIEEIDFIEDVKPTIKQLRAAVVALSKLPNEVIGKMHRDDFTALCEVVVPLLSGSGNGTTTPITANDGPETTSTPSPQTAPTGSTSDTATSATSP